MEGAVAIALAVAVIAGLSLVLHYTLFVRSGTWGISDRLSMMEARFLLVIADYQEKEAAATEAMRRDFYQKLDEHENRFGETARAMQQKIHEIETWSRDEFVRRSSFEQALTRIESAMVRSDAKMDDIQKSVSKIAVAVGGKPNT